jgi:hypothetical protein
MGSVQDEEWGKGAYRNDVGIAHDGVSQLERDDDLHFERGHVPVDGDVFDVQ